MAPFTSLMTTWSTRASRFVSASRNRSCVMGRAKRAFSKAIPSWVASFMPTQMGTMRYFPGCDGSSMGCSTRMEGAGAADTIRVCTLTGFIAAPRWLGFAGTSIALDYTARLRYRRLTRKAFSSRDGPVANRPHAVDASCVDPGAPMVWTGREDSAAVGSFGFREVQTSASPGQPFEIPCEKCLTKPLILGYSIQALFYGPVAQLVRAHA